MLGVVSSAEIGRRGSSQSSPTIRRGTKPSERALFQNPKMPSRS
jgi:hypothetical protein